MVIILLQTPKSNVAYILLLSAGITLLTKNGQTLSTVSLTCM